MGRGLRIQPLTRSDWQRTGFSQRVYAGLDDRMGRDERHAAGVVPDQRLKARVKTLTSA